MTFEEILDQAIAMLQRRGRVTYRLLKRQFQLDDDSLGDLLAELRYAHREAISEDEQGIGWTGGAADAMPTTPQTSDAERRQLTVLFCDLVDSTRLASELDPEDLREVVRAYQETCAKVIARFDGHIAQYLGDGLLVYFGYPLAHEDDAQRAVRAGLGILDAVQALSGRLAHDKGVRVAVRLGIHTGLVVVGSMGSGDRQEQLALGETPNMAARLQGLAMPGTLVMSEATSRLVQGYFVCQDLGLHTVKGVDQPIAAYQVLQESAAQSRLDVAAIRGLTPLVGREEEVGLLLRRWVQSQEGLGHVMLLSGEAGIGKSRLVEVLRERVGQEGYTHLAFRCLSYNQQSALYPVIEQLQRRLQWRRDDTPETKLTKLEQALQAYRFALDEVVPLLAALLSVPLPEARYAPLHLSPQRQRQKTLAALLAWLLAEAERQPTLLVWEDMHWADPSTLEFLSLLIEQTPTARLLMLLTCRPEFRPPWVFRSYLTQLTLSRLGRAQVETMIERITGDKALPAAVVQQIVTKTDGVPLFVEELTKAILESSLLRQHEDCYELTGPLPSLAIPATLHDSLMARLDRLAAGKEVAQLAATLGRTLPYELLRAVSALDEATLQQTLARLVEAELLYQRGVPPQATYMFKHALIQDAAYQSLLKSTRQQYHRRIAQALAEHFPDTAEAQPELLAHHYTEAGLAEPAVAYWQRAGKRTKYVGEREAVAHFSKGLAVLQTLPDTPGRTQQELDLLIDLGIGLGDTKGAAAPEVAQVWDRARTLCQHMEDTPHLFRVLTQLRTVHTARAEHQTARDFAEQALALAQRLQRPGLLVCAHYSCGIPLLHLGAMASARGHFEQAIVHYDARRGGSQAGFTVQALGYVAQTLWVLGYPEQALQRQHEARTMLQQWSHPSAMHEALYNASGLHGLRREVQAVHECTAAALALTSEHGSAPMLALLQHQQGWVLAAQGRYEEGIAQMRQGLATLWTMGEAVGRPRLLALLAEAYGKSGQAEEGLRLLAEALALMDNTGERQEAAEVHRLKGELLLWQAIPDAPQAEACLQQALAIARCQQAKSWELRAATSLGRLWQRQGKRTEARELLAPTYGWFTEGFDTADLQEAKVLLDALA
jgi:class 3 adenylate cyclase/predicted ATPase